MPHPNAEKYRLFAEVMPLLGNRLRPAFGIVLGSPHEVADLVERLQLTDPVCYQMDHVQADRLQHELDARLLTAQVKVAADLWDLAPDFQTLLYPAPHGGERSLKIDMIEQSFHVLKPHGILVVLSTYEKDQLFPQALKKVYGKVHMPQSTHGAIFWCQRQGEHPRRRHEVTYQVSGGLEQSLRFLSRPGVFCYGRFDDGARALVEVMEIEPGQRILDMGCGAGTNGIIASLKTGPEGSVVFADSSARAVVLADYNARNLGLKNFQTLASSNLQELAPASFDVVLANPPYHALTSIARFFVEKSHEVLKPAGKIFLVTKQPDSLVSWMNELFSDIQAVHHRGYFILSAVKRKP